MVAQLTAKVSDKLTLKNQMLEDEHLRLWEKNIAKRKAMIDKEKKRLEDKQYAYDERREAFEEKAMKKA